MGLVTGKSWLMASAMAYAANAFDSLIFWVILAAALSLCATTFERLGGELGCTAAELVVDMRDSILEEVAQW